jgi:hypothetical protein
VNSFFFLGIIKIYPRKKRTGYNYFINKKKSIIMGLFLGNDIETLYLGNEEIDEIYLGNELIWSAGLPVGTVFNFGYTGNVQSVELPRGKYKLQCWGAQGGTSYGSSSGAGSKGGYSEGVLTLNETKTLYVFVGGQGSRGSSSSLVNGGWNGGGASVGYSSYNSSGTYGYSYPACGGGATDISTVTSSMSYSSGRTNRSSASLLARCIVAGGGAGGSYRYTKTETTIEDLTDVCTISGAAKNYDNVGIAVAVLSFDFIGGETYRLINYNGTSGYVECFETTNGVSTYITNKTISNGATITIPSNANRFWIYFFKSGASVGDTIEGTFVKVETTTSTSNSSGYSNKSQQGGGTSGRGQYPGTQTSAGSGGGFGYGGNQTITNYRYLSGAGGGGWYGGGKSYSDSSTNYINYSGGGSGFVNIALNASKRPSGYTGLELDSGTTMAGNSSFPSTSGGTETGHSGNGYARITVIE